MEKSHIVTTVALMKQIFDDKVRIPVFEDLKEMGTLGDIDLEKIVLYNQPMCFMHRMRTIGFESHVADDYPPMDRIREITATPAPPDTPVEAVVNDTDLDSDDDMDLD